MLFQILFFCLLFVFENNICSYTKDGTNTSLDIFLRLQGDDSETNVQPTKDTSKLINMNTVTLKLS